MVVGILGILKAGASYLPLDANYPAERLSYMLGDSRACGVVTQSSLDKSIPGWFSGWRVRLDQDWEEIGKQSPEAIENAVSAENLAYVIYTSGSTGTPNGVGIAHRSVANFFDATVAAFQIDETSRLLQFASISFDAAVWEIVSALCSGATLCLARQESILPGEPLTRLVETQAITHMLLPPSSLQALSSAELPTVRTLIVGGEACPASVLEEWARSKVFINAYGPTECTVAATTARCHSDMTTAPIGRPLSNTRVYVMDAGREAVPVGVTGELYIGGAGLARGYVGRGGLTAARFVPHPYLPGERVYRTGDLVRWNERGELEFLGRSDDQVKIRGYRIELGEIETVLREYAGVSEAVVVAREDVPGEKRLVGYVVSAAGEAPESTELRAYLKQRLPGYMVPSAIVRLERMPFTGSGKINRKALPAPDPNGSSSLQYEPPLGELEERLARLWRELLRVERVGRQDSFFDLGGHSLLAVQLVTRIRMELDRELPLRKLFEHPTLSGMSAQMGGAAAPVAPIPQAERTQPLPLSYAQEGLWFIDQLDGGGAAYNIPTALRLHGDLNLTALQSALDTLLLRHEVLRTTFLNDQGTPVQVIGEPRPFPLQLVDLGGHPLEEREAEVRRHVLEESQQRFVLSTGPLIRGRLLRLDDKEHVLLLGMHHIVSDGWSIGILSHELGALYRAYREGLPDPLPRLPIQYADYAVWQRQRLHRQEFEKQLAYWKGNLKAASPVELPLDRPRPAVQSYRGALYSFSIDASVASALRELARRADATLYMTLLAAFQVLLSRLSAQQDVVVASPIAGRLHPQTEELIGLFVNTLLIRTVLPGDESFTQLLERVKDTTLNAYTHQDLPFGRLISELHSEPAGPRLALARIGFALQNAPMQSLELEGLSLQSEEQSHGTARNDMSLVLHEAMGSLGGAIEYSTDLFDESTIAAMVQRFLSTLKAVTARPDAPIDTIDLTVPMPSSDPAVFRPLCASQRAMWLDMQARPFKSSYYNLREVVEIRGAIDPAVFEEAIRCLISKRAALRLEFGRDSFGVPVQRILPARAFALEFVDLSAHGGAPAVKDWLENASRQMLDPLTDTPFRFALLKESDSAFHWYAHYHHLIVDGFGAIQIRRHVAQLYTALMQGDTPVLTPDTDDYLKYLHQDSEYRNSRRYLADRAYWSESLGDARGPSLSVHTKAGRPGDPVRVKLSVPDEIVASLKRRAAETGETLSALLVAAVGLFTSRMTACDRLCLGMPTHGRFDRLTREMVGPFATISPVEFHVDRKASVAEGVKAITRALRGSLRHGRFRNEDIRRLRGLGPQDPPLFGVTVNLLPDLESAPLNFFGSTGLSKFMPLHEDDLMIWIVPAVTQDALMIQLDGNPHQYQSWELESHLKRLGEFLESFVNIPDLGACSVGELPLLPAAARDQVIVEFNSTVAPYSPLRCVHELFEEQAERELDVIAVEYEEQRLTYRELNERANQLAHYLGERGIGPDQLVAILMERSLETLVAILGILKAGGAYLPLDPAYPPDRLEYMLQDAKPRLLVTQRSHADSFHPGTVALVELDQEWPAIALQPTGNVQCAVKGLNSRHLAYVIYTSGSTGQPKGVMVEHRQLVHMTDAVEKTYHLRPGDRLLQFASLSFDTSVEDCFAALTAGSTLVLRSEKWLSTEEEFWTLCERAKITTLNLPTAYWHYLASSDTARLPLSLRQVIVGGEEVRADIVSRWFSRKNPIPRLLNTYGPTETTVNATTGVVSAAGCTIGKPISNAQIYVLDEQLEAAPVGVAGEIYVGGAGVVRGYLNRPQLTAERFLVDPFSAGPGTRLYRTGDVGRWRADGNIEYLGRNDDQVKIRGYRIELGEIEAQLGTHDAVREAVVMVREDVPGDKRLVGYYTSRAPVSAGQLRAYLAGRLPAYMVPGEYVMVESLPVTPGGKVDRQQLPAPERRPRGSKHETPSTPTEEALVRIWAEVLHVPQVGIRDNFFELGGDSIKSVRLCARIRQELGRELPLNVLFAQPYVYEVARWITESPGGAASGLIPLRKGQNARRMLAFLPTILGSGLHYGRLVRKLTSDCAMGTCRIPGGDPSETILTSVQEIAAHCRRSLVVPGEYEEWSLLGWSFGGVVAYEMAAQMVASGIPVKRVIPWGPHSCHRQRRTVIAAKSRHWLLLLTSCWRCTSGIPANRSRYSRLDTNAAFQVYQANLAALQSYDPRPCKVPVTEIRTAKTSRGLEDGTYTGRPIGSFSADSSIVIVPGDHYSVFSPRYISKLARAVDAIVSGDEGERGDKSR